MSTATAQAWLEPPGGQDLPPQHCQSTSVLAPNAHFGLPQQNARFVPGAQQYRRVEYPDPVPRLPRTPRAARGTEPPGDRIYPPQHCKNTSVLAPNARHPGTGSTLATLQKYFGSGTKRAFRSRQQTAHLVPGAQQYRRVAYPDPVPPAPPFAPSRPGTATRGTGSTPATLQKYFGSGAKRAFWSDAAKCAFGPRSSAISTRWIPGSCPPAGGLATCGSRPCGRSGSRGSPGGSRPRCS